MIAGFRHKGLRLLFEEDDGRKLNADQLDRLRLILSALNAAERAEDMNQPTFRLHPLKRGSQGQVGRDGAGKLAGDLSLCARTGP